MARNGTALAFAFMASAFLPAVGVAAERGFFAGIDAFGGGMHGSSSTRDGGAPIAGGGVVEDVKFRSATGIGGHAGYRFNAWSMFAGYQHFRGKVSWDADFPLYGVASSFAGRATSNVITANVAREFPLSGALAVTASAGAGIASNTLSGVVEKDVASGLFLSDVGGRSKTSPVARMDLGLQYRPTPKTRLGLGASFVYGGDFRTADWRSGNLGVTEIRPYRIDGVWRAGLLATVQRDF